MLPRCRVMISWSTQPASQYRIVCSTSTMTSSNCVCHSTRALMASTRSSSLWLDDQLRPMTTASSRLRQMALGLNTGVNFMQVIVILSTEVQTFIIIIGCVRYRRSSHNETLTRGRKLGPLLQTFTSLPQFPRQKIKIIQQHAIDSKNGQTIIMHDKKSAMRCSTMLFMLYWMYL